MTKSAAIDSTHVKAQRAVFGVKKALSAGDRPSAQRLNDQVLLAKRRHETPLRADADLP